MTQRYRTLSHETFETCGFTVHLSRKNVRNVNLRVRPDGSLAISASPRVTHEELCRIVADRREWIEQAQRRQAQKAASEQQGAAEGATIGVWGKTLQLHIVNDKSAASPYAHELRKEGDQLQMHCGTRLAQDDSVAEGLRERALESWLREQLVAEATRLMPICEEVVGKRCSTLRFRSMKTRWGSCNVRTGAITLNTKLVHHPVRCLRYVIMHELCHLHEPSHNARFHTLMDGFCPSWREDRAILNERG